MPQICGPNKKTKQQEEKREDSSSRAISNQNLDRPDTSAAADVQQAEEEKALIACLCEHGVNRADAVRLAHEQPDECRRQLEYLPFVPAFKSGRGAYLRSAVEQGFGPPVAYAKAQQRQERVQQPRTDATAQRAMAKQSRRETLLGELRTFATQMEQEQPEAFAGFQASMQNELRQLLQRFNARAAQDSYRKLYAGEAKRLERFAAYFATNPCPLSALTTWLTLHSPVAVASALLEDRRR